MDLRLVPPRSPTTPSSVGSRRQAKRDQRLAGTQRRTLKNDTSAVVSPIAGIGIAFVILGAVIGLLLIAKLSPTLINAGTNATSAISDADFGDDTVNDMKPVFVLIISLSLLIGIVLLILGSLRFGTEQN